MATIGIFDSGSGGLSVLKEMLKVLPDERYIYYSDNANCPYGEKSAEFICERAESICSMLIEKGAEIIVVACNTATAAAIASLRKRFAIPFVGMEPAVKPAALGTRSGVIGVLATEGTLKASKYLNTKDRFSGGVRIEEHVGRGFVELVESLELDGKRARGVVEASLLPLLEAGADVIVLGCTHYPFLLPLMESIAKERGYEVRFIDPAPAVSRHLVEVAAERGISSADPNPGVILLSSGPKESLERLYRSIL